MDLAAQIIMWINTLTNGVGKFVLGPVIKALPGWLSNTIISAVTGVLLLIIFKYTSNQKAIGRVRDSIKANLLALKLFKDSLAVTFKSQGRVFKGAFMLLFYSVRPMLVMIVPVSLLLAQMALWYQARPLRVGEEALVTMQLNNNIGSVWPVVDVSSNPAAEVTAGPVRVLNKRQIYWQIQALENGEQRITFQAGQQQVEKKLAVGEGFKPVSAQRPGWHWSNILMHPYEKPFAPDSVIQSISIDYPDRLGRISGTGWWLVYFFVASMVFALLFKPFLKVRI
jgi:uncharacterized membrane protein (DUF106 family)